VRELQYAKKNTLLNSKGLREFVLQNCPYHSFTLQMWVGIRNEIRAFGHIAMRCEVNIPAARHCGQWY